jgi:adenosylhomocysteine nucleosidase
VVFGTTGDGPICGLAGAAALCDAVSPRLLLGAGVAGALSRELRAEDVVVAKRIRDDRGEAPSPDARMVDRAVSIAAAKPAILVTVDRPVTGSAEKRSLAASLGIEGPAVVDMESGGWARAAAARGVPYLIARAVSDTADEELPSYLSECVGPDGRLRRTAVVRSALAHPSTIVSLARMRRRLRACAEQLSIVLEKLLAGGL